jgi:N utilization substance protein B
MIDQVEKNILRMGVYELQAKPEIPYRVVINESVELAKRFGAEESHKYINGVLDKVALQLRSLEKTQMD